MCTYLTQGGDSINILQWLRNKPNMQQALSIQYSTTTCVLTYGSAVTK